MKRTILAVLAAAAVLVPIALAATVTESINGTIVNNGRNVNGSVSWTANPTGGPYGRADFIVDGNVVASDTTSPYGITYDTTAIDDGSHSFKVGMFAGRDTPGPSVTKTVNVNNPGGDVTADTHWTCSGPVDIGTLTVTNHGSGDAVTLAAGCTGTIDNVQISGMVNGDGIKVQGGVHDLTIGGGLVQCAGPSTDGTHQDGTQVMGGTNITFNRVVFDCYGPAGGGNVFIQQAGSQTPSGVTCVHCALGPNRGSTHNLNLGPSVNSGAQDSLVCQSGASEYFASGATNPVNTNNTYTAAGDPNCADTASLQAWAAAP